MIRRLGLTALAGIVAVAGCGGGEEPAATTATPPPEAAAGAAGDVTGDVGRGEEGIAGGGGQAPAAGADAEEPSFRPPDASGEDLSADELRDYVERQGDVVERIRAAAERAREEGDPRALEELGAEMRPQPGERQEIRRLLEQYCARPDARDSVCERLGRRASG